MTSAQLPTPGRLILENITLLAGSPTAFHARYGYTLTSTTFSKSGNTAQANAVLHFLISIIDVDVAESLFKPCFPILDRDQERDFRKVVDARLAILERTKLLPSGCARKSVVAAAGGDKFLDLLWSLSSLALQQASLRHPAYGSVSRMRLLSNQSQSDTSSQHSLSQQTSSRSTRSFLSGRSSRHDRHQPDPSRPRRFLGVGMLTVSQQRQKDAEEMRARIDAERMALNRTTEMGQHGAKTWGSEADSLRERISDFEAKLRTLKGQLAGMGFDENGVDIRASSAQSGVANSVKQTKEVSEDGVTSGVLIASHSNDELAEELKTSPIESTESCSSVDDSGDACDELAANLSRLLSFTAESEEQRIAAEEAMDVKKPTIPLSTMAGNTESRSNSKVTVDEGAAQDAKEIVDLVREATDELEEVTNRMREIREAREGAGNPGTPDHQFANEVNDEVLEEARETPAESQEKSESGGQVVAGDDGNCSSAESFAAGDTVSQKQNDSSEFGQGLFEESRDKPESNVKERGSTKSKQLEQKAANVLEEHNVVVESSRRLQKQAATLSTKAAEVTDAGDANISSSTTSRETFVEVISKPHWYTSAATNSTKGKKNITHCPENKKSGKPPRGKVSTLADVAVAAKTMQNGASSHSSRSSSARRRKEGTRSLDSINLDLNSALKRSPSSPENQIDAIHSPSESNSSLKGTPRSVRFAELPPSYRASRTSENSREGSPVRNARDSDEQFVKNVRKALETRAVNKQRENQSDLCPREPSTDTKTEPSTVTEAQTKEPKGNLTSRKHSKSHGKSDTSARKDSNKVRPETSRAGGVSSQKPPRVQRARTLHRIARSKEASPHPGSSRQHSQFNARPARSFTSRSTSLGEISRFQKPQSKPGVKRDTEEVTLETADCKRVVGRSVSSSSSKVELNGTSSEKQTMNEEGESHMPVNDMNKIEPNSPEKKESLQKKLFMTPESATSSSKTAKHFPRLTRRSSTGVLHCSNRENLDSAKELQRNHDVTAVMKGSSADFSSADEEELLFSPAPKPPLAGHSGAKKTDSGGFFAGKAAEWQQSVRAQSTTTRHSETASSRGLSENPGRFTRGSGKTPSSGMRSKVQSLRARLAALK